MNKRKKLTASLILLMICVLILSSQISCKSPSEITQNMQQRTVEIVFVSQQKQGDTAVSFTPIGTGILVNNDGYLITANHLLDAGDQYVQKTQAEVKSLGIIILAPGGAYGGSGSPLSAINDFDVIARDSKHDLALLKIKMLSVTSPLNGKTLLTVNFNRNVGGSLNVGVAHFSTGITRNNAIAVTGYISNAVTEDISDQLMPETRKGNVTSKEMTSISSSQLSVATGSITYSISDYYQTDITSNPVLSGSPVYFPKNGDIVGICVSIQDGQAATIIIPCKYIVDLITTNGVDLK
jgi:S1-C subfamily serine protease